MENQGLLIIPDISGFSRFVHETEIEHSRLVIQELLEILLNANQMDLEVSEIEGDAILFYKFGEAPPLEILYRQVEKMFCLFHKNLIAYDQRRYCQCRACMSAVNLTLKIITHYGEFTNYKVKNFKKLIGKDVIIAHQLLKNEIEQHEYWLVTKNILHNNQPVDFKQWMIWNSQVKQTEFGEINYHYTQLSQLKNELLPDPVPQPDFSRMVKMISRSQEYETDIITLFHAGGDFKYRSQWQDGVKLMEEYKHLLPRIGMQGRCMLENGEVIIIASSYSYRSDRIEFGETELKNGNLTYYTLERTSENKTKLTIDYYIKKRFQTKFLFRLLRLRKMENSLSLSLQNLVGLVKEIKVPKAVED